MRILIICFLALFFAACGEQGQTNTPSEQASHDQNTSENETQDPTVTESQDDHVIDSSDEPAEETQALAIELNDGAPWQMDEHTRTKFQDMASRLDSGLENQELGAKLQEDLDALIAGCTMTGDAHDQLHVYLTAFMPAVKSLAETGDQESADSVKELLSSYTNYFE